MARNEHFVVEGDVESPRDEEVKSLPEDVDEDNFDKVVQKDPELQKDMSDSIDETTRGAKPAGSYKEPSDDVSDLVDE